MATFKISALVIIILIGLPLCGYCQETGDSSESVAQGVRNNDVAIFQDLILGHHEINPEVLEALLSLLESPKEKHALMILAYGAHEFSLETQRGIASALIAKVPESHHATMLIRARINDWPSLVIDYIDEHGVDEHGRLLRVLTGLRMNQVSKDSYDQIHRLVTPFLGAETVVLRAMAMRTWYHFEAVPDRQLAIREKLRTLITTSDDQETSAQILRILADIQHPEDFNWLWDIYQDKEHSLRGEAVEVMLHYVNPDMEDAAVERLLSLAQQWEHEDDQNAAMNVYHRLYQSGFRSERFVNYMAQRLQSEDKRAAWNAVLQLVNARKTDRSHSYRHPRWDALIRALDVSDPTEFTGRLGEVPPSVNWSAWREVYFRGRNP